MTDDRLEPSLIVREFKAPRDLVFNAWTQVEHLDNWMFPMPGCSCEYVEADIREGGSSLHRITMPNGHQMWLLTRYEAVQFPEKLVFLQYMSNEAGELVPNPQMPDWPRDMVATLVFEAIDTGTTRLSFYWEPRNPTPAERAAFEASRSDHGKGWGAGMEQLHNYLEALSARD